MSCTLRRVGTSSNLRDRICLYQRVLGVTIENNLGVESARNSEFMQTFNRLIDYMLEYYKTKQLAQEIQAQAGTAVSTKKLFPPRSRAGSGFPAKFDKLQRVIEKAPGAFRKHDIELEPGKKYNVGGQESRMIKNAPNISDLRHLEWAKRFYRAGLEDDAIIGQIRVFREIVNPMLKKYDPKNYLERFKNSYPNLWAFIFEAHNSRPYPLQRALAAAAAKAAAINIYDPLIFARLLIEDLKAVTRKFFGEKKYAGDSLENERIRSETIKYELGKIDRIIEKTLKYKSKN